MQPDKTSVAQFEAGLAKTVSPEQSVIRLDGIAGLTLKPLGHDKRIDKIGQLRNRVVHFTVPTEDASIGVATVYGHALNFALWFLDNEFRGKANGDIEELVEEVIEQLTSELRYIQELVSDRMGTIDETLDGADVCVDCPRCEQPALMLFEQSQSVYCGYCLWNPQDGSSAAQEYEEAVLGGSYNESAGPGGPVWDCPRCSSPALVEGVKQRRPSLESLFDGGCDTQPLAYWACFDCGWTGAVHDLDHCDMCNVVTDTGDEGMSICEECFASRLSKD